MKNPEITFEALQSVAKSLSKKYVFSDRTLEALSIGMMAGKNLILYGPGGHSKSTITEDFFKELEIVPFVQTMGQGMTPDRLFGGIDMKKLNDEGKIEYLVENSFMEHEYVIFEELFDCPDYILEQLKDILSSGIFRNGSQIIPIKTKFIVGNTNRTREEYAKKDASIKALMERFPLELEVKWKAYSRDNYAKLFEARYGESNAMLTYILEEFDKKEKTISPRIALAAYEIFEQFGKDGLLFIADFAKDPKILSQAFVKFESVSKLASFRKELEDFMKEVPLDAIDKVDNMAELKKLSQKINEIKQIESKVQSLTVDDNMATEKAEATKMFKEVYKSYSGKLAQIVKQLTEGI